MVKLNSSSLIKRSMHNSLIDTCRETQLSINKLNNNSILSLSVIAFECFYLFDDRTDVNEVLLNDGFDIREKDELNRLLRKFRTISTIRQLKDAIYINDVIEGMQKKIPFPNKKGYSYSDKRQLWFNFDDNKGKYSWHQNWVYLEHPDINLILEFILLVFKLSKNVLAPKLKDLKSNFGKNFNWNANSKSWEIIDNKQSDYPQYICIEIETLTDKLTMPCPVCGQVALDAIDGEEFTTCSHLVFIYSQDNKSFRYKSESLKTKWNISKDELINAENIVDLFYESGFHQSLQIFELSYSCPYGEINDHIIFYGFDSLNN